MQVRYSDIQPAFGKAGDLPLTAISIDNPWTISESVRSVSTTLIGRGNKSDEDTPQQSLPIRADMARVLSSQKQVLEAGTEFRSVLLVATFTSSHYNLISHIITHKISALIIPSVQRQSREVLPQGLLALNCLIFVTNKYMCRRQYKLHEVQ